MAIAILIAKNNVYPKMAEVQRFPFNVTPFARQKRIGPLTGSCVYVLGGETVNNIFFKKIVGYYKARDRHNIFANCEGARKVACYVANTPVQVCYFRVKGLP